MSIRTLLAGVIIVATSSLANASDQPPPAAPLNLVGHSHTAVTVSDLDKTLAWYQKVLGMEVLFVTDVTGEGIDEVMGEAGSKLRLSKGKIADTIVEFIEIQHREG